MGKYPAPDPSFESTPFTDELIYRLQQYRDRHELLPGVAYYILERLEQSLIGDKKNRRRLLGGHMKVQKKVLEELSEGSATAPTQELAGTRQRILYLSRLPKPLGWMLSYSAL